MVSIPAHQPKETSVSLTPQTPEEITHLREEMHRDREAVARQYAEAITVSEGELRDLDRKINGLHAEITAKIHLRGQMMAQRAYQNADFVLREIRGLTFLLGRSQQEREALQQKIKYLKGRKQGLADQE